MGFKIGRVIVWLVCGAMVILAWFFVWKFLPETKGVPLEAMQELFYPKPADEPSPSRSELQLLR